MLVLALSAWRNVQAGKSLPENHEEILSLAILASDSEP
jgi:hypothetical protein